jgi:hypothetical protein
MGRKRREEQRGSAATSSHKSLENAFVLAVDCFEFDVRNSSSLGFHG